jgi:hypothetical protein
MDDQDVLVIRLGEMNHMAKLLKDGVYWVKILDDPFTYRMRRHWGFWYFDDGGDYIELVDFRHYKYLYPIQEISPGEQSWGTGDLSAFINRGHPKSGMDRRSTRNTMLKEIDRLEALVENLFEAAMWGIEHVGMANYASREQEAKDAIDKAYEGEPWEES